MVHAKPLHMLSLCRIKSNSLGKVLLITAQTPNAVKGSGVGFF